MMHGLSALGNSIRLRAAHVIAALMHAAPIAASLVAAQSLLADLTISGGAANARYGGACAVATVGSTRLLAVSAPGLQTGRIDVYSSVENAQWQLETISTVQPLANPRVPLVGFSLAMRGLSDGTAVLAVGSPGDNINGGRVIVLTRSVDGSWSTDQSLVAPGLVQRDGFGYSVALSADGKMLAVGSPGDRPDGSGGGIEFFGRGRVDVFRRVSTGDYVRSATITTPFALGPFDGFGAALAFTHSGNAKPELLVGIPGQTHALRPGAGRVLVLRENTPGNWSRIKTIGSTADGVIGFGSTIAATASTAVVGAPRGFGFIDGTSVLDAGRAFLLKKIDGSWSLSSELAFPEEPSLNDQRGASVAIDGNTIAVGHRTARASIFRRDTTGAFRRIDQIADLALSGQTGGKVALGGGIAAISATTSTVGAAQNSGTVFLRDVVPTKFISGLATVSGNFGTSLAMVGNRVAVGAPLDATLDGALVLEKGSVRIMDRVNGVWIEDELLVGDTALGGFGSVVAMPSASRLLVGAPLDSAAPRAFLFEREDDGAWARTEIAPANLAPGVATNPLRFGSAIAAVMDEGEVLFAIGAEGERVSGQVDVGSVRVGRTTGGVPTQSQILLPPSASEELRFGSALAMQRYADGTVDLFVGAPGHSGAGSPASSGALFLYRRAAGESNFALVDGPILPPDAASFDLAGTVGTIAIRNSILVWGIPNRAPASDDLERGIAYAFRRGADGSWSRVAGSITSARNPLASQSFLTGTGASVATNGTQILVGVPADSRAILARISGGSLQVIEALAAPDRELSARYGASLGISTGLTPSIVVGAPFDRCGDLDFSGGAYGFDAEINDCAADLNEDGFVDLADIELCIAQFGTTGDSDGVPSPDLDGNGIVDTIDLWRVVVAQGVCFP
jgi:hypothetical protein